MITAPPPVRTIATRTLGTIGLTWALAYVPIHVYWGLGGTSTPIGITGTQSGFRVANWGACVVIVGAGLTCLALTRPWGERLPDALRRGTAWVGGLFALAHWLLYTARCAWPARSGTPSTRTRRRSSCARSTGPTWATSSCGSA